MGQEEVIKLLKKHGKLSRKELSDKLGIGQRAIDKSLAQLFKFGEIQKIMGENGKTSQYTIKNGNR